jgi:hypothetical protein
MAMRTKVPEYFCFTILVFKEVASTLFVQFVMAVAEPLSVAAKCLGDP